MLGGGIGSRGRNKKQITDPRPGISIKTFISSDTAERAANLTERRFPDSKAKGVHLAGWTMEPIAYGSVDLEW